MDIEINQVLSYKINNTTIKYIPLKNMSSLEINNSFILISQLQYYSLLINLNIIKSINDFNYQDFINQNKLYRYFKITIDSPID